MDNKERPSVENLLIFQKAYDYVKWVIPTVERFPKSQRFTLGAYIANNSIEMLDLVIEAQYSRNRQPLLEKLNTVLEKLRLFIRMAKELQFLPFSKYESGTKMLVELGRMVGGWKKGGQR
jgi:hypothetical protein